MNDNVRVYLSIGSLLIVAGMITGFFFIDPPKENLRLLDTSLGFAAGFVSASFGYYFGATFISRKEIDPNESTDKSRSSLDG